MKPRYAKGTRLVDSRKHHVVVGAASVLGDICVYRMIDLECLGSARYFHATEGALDSQYKAATPAQVSAHDAGCPREVYSADELEEAADTKRRNV